MFARRAAAVLVAVAMLGACGEPDPVAPLPTAPDTPISVPSPPSTATDRGQTGMLYPDVVDAVLTANDDGTWTMAATISSPYDGPDRYADAFRVLTPDGQELTVRVLTHDHADEQPFTRSSDAFEIPDSVTEVTVEGRDQVSSWGGDTVQVDVPQR